MDISLYDSLFHSCEPAGRIVIYHYQYKLSMNKSFMIAGGACLLLASCGGNAAQEMTSDMTFDGTTVTVSEHSSVNSKIRLHRVELKNFSAEFTTTGVVKPVNGRMAEIAPLFDGRVTRSFVGLGQRVGAGTPLFELYSAEFSEAVKNYFQSLQNRKQAESNLLRQKDLVANGVGVVRELEEAETAFQVASAEYENSVTGLSILHIDPSKIAMGQPLTVNSPIAGEVVQADITVGQYVKSDGAPLAVVADLGKVWVAAQVKERQIGAIRMEDEVEIRTDAYPEEPFAGRILYIGELLDEETRSVQVLIECDNTDRRLKPGMFAGVRFICTPKEAIVIPSAAVLQNEDEAFVYVEQSKGTYVRRPVEAVTVDGQQTRITAGLESGDVIVAQGAIYLMGN